MIEEYNQAKVRVGGIKPDSSLNILKKAIPKALDGIVVFTDASFKADSGEGAFGVVIVDGKENL